MVKFDKRKHKKARWITSSLLKSINIKDKLYKKLIKTIIDKDPKIVILKNKFINFKNMLRRSINGAKRLC